ncbi:MAG: S-layer homology domain-containing protein, partial [Dehalococcoidia bacterium]
SDVPADHWAYEEILALHQRGVITGHGDGTFGPDAVVLRSEFAKMMVLALDLSLADAASPT